MTKRRPPLSIDAALARIAGQLPGGWSMMAEIADRRERTVRNWGDPDTPEQVPVDCAVRLDIAFQEAGGDGAPILEVYALLLEASAQARFADRAALGRLAQDAILECGEANAAIVAAAQPGADAAVRAAGTKEVEEALAVLKSALAMLQDPVRATGPP